jgi:hypothetical protein
MIKHKSMAAKVLPHRIQTQPKQIPSKIAINPLFRNLLKSNQNIIIGMRNKSSAHGIMKIFTLYWFWPPNLVFVIRIVVSDQGGRLEGSIVFYFLFKIFMNKKLFLESLSRNFNHWILWNPIHSIDGIILEVMSWSILENKLSLIRH